MGFNPLKEKGTPIEKQFRNWEQLNVEPYDKEDVDPYTRTRIILMNGIEIAATLFLHHATRHCSDPEVQRKLAAGRRIEQMQQKIINWLSPGNESALEITIGYEQVAVDLTAWLAKNEPDHYVKEALNYGLLEDFDHLYRFANLLDLRMPGKAEKIVGGYTEIFPGRETKFEHIHPFDSIRKPIDKNSANIQTKLNTMIILAGEQQTMNFYMNNGNSESDRLGRRLYQEIAMIEEEHVTHYGTLLDPTSSMWERLLLCEYMECYMYYSCMKHEVDERIRKIWEECLMDELDHIKIAAELFKKYEKRDPEELIPDDFPKLLKFEPNKEYVREVLKREHDLTSNLTNFEDKFILPKDHRYFKYQDTVNKGVNVPSDEIITKMCKVRNEDYRFESEGPHPIKELQKKETCKIR